jgi:hypothetical protein
MQTVGEGREPWQAVWRGRERGSRSGASFVPERHTESALERGRMPFGCAAVAQPASAVSPEAARDRSVEGASLYIASCVRTGTERTSARSKVARCHRRMGFQRDGMLFAAGVPPPSHATPSMLRPRSATMGSNDDKSPVLAPVVHACTYDLASTPDHRVPHAESCRIPTPSTHSDAMEDAHLVGIPRNRAHQPRCRTFTRSP